MYLCKNGAGIRIELLENRKDYTFILKNISVQDSGNYSCAYSFKKNIVHNVKESGMNSIHVQVTGKTLYIYIHICIFLSLI